MESTLSTTRFGRPSVVAIVAVLGLLALTAIGLSVGTTKVLIIAWVAFLAMAGFALPGASAAKTSDAFRLVWGYGLAAGAMVTSAAVFLVPQAVGLGGAAGNPQIGGFGIAAGLLLGYAAHTIGHRLSHIDTPFDNTAAQLAAHSLSAGAIIGLVYAAMPDLGLLLGLAIVSHKGPAGYAAARRLRRADKPVSVLLLPAAGVGLTAIPLALVSPPANPAVNAVIFGFAAGVFLHVAMDFLPTCEVGSEVGEVAGLTHEDHALLDRLRVHAVASTVLGAVAVFGAWLLIV
jgi:ZIP family zinc transporter